MPVVDKGVAYGDNPVVKLMAGNNLRFRNPLVGRTNAIMSVALLGALCCASLRAQVYTEHSGPNTMYLNRPPPPGYSVLTREILVTNESNKALDTVTDIVQPPNYSAPKNGFTVFTMDENGFKSDNYLNGWADPKMALLPANAWFVKNPYDLKDHNLSITYSTNSSPAGFPVGSSMPPIAEAGLASAVYCPTAEGDVVGDRTYRKSYAFTNNQWLPGRPAIAIGEYFYVHQKYVTNQPAIWFDEYLQVGQVNFFTFNATNVEFGQVMDTRGNPLSANGLGQLYAGTNGNENQFVPVGKPVGFSTNVPGYISSAVVSIPFVAGGQSVNVQLRAWQRADGPSFEAASARHAPVGLSSTMPLIAHARIERWVLKMTPGDPPLDVNGFPSFRLAVRPAASAHGLSPNPSNPK